MKKKLLKFLAVACSLTCMATAGLGSVFSADTNPLTVAKAYEITLDNDSALKDEYAYGELLNIPMGSIDGQPTTKVLVFSPTGKVYEASSLNLMEAGQYTVVWYATVNGKEVSAQKSFCVTKSVFSVDGGAEYKQVEKIPQLSDLSKKEESESEETSSMAGIQLALQAESSVRYNQAIDLRDTSVPFAHLFPYHGITNLEKALHDEYDKEPKLRAYNAKVSALKKKLKDEGITDEKAIQKAIEKELGPSPTDYSPEYAYHEEARNYIITLTDCYDPTNVVTIDLEWQEGRTYWNFRAGAQGQTAHGLRPVTDKKIKDNNIAPESIVSFDGDKYAIYYAPGQGRTSCNKTDEYGLQLYYDTVENQVSITFCRYTCDDDKGTKKDVYTVNDESLVADLDHTQMYPDNPFKGFTTGEVYVSFSAKNYVGNVANMYVASLGGVSGAEILKADMHDTKAPTIEVDKELLQNSRAIALNEEVQIPSAIAHDLSIPYGTKATTAVYYAYNPNSERNVLVGLSADGKFTPKKLGVYTIVYTATDASGNTTTETVDLQCGEGINNKAVQLTVEEQIEWNAGRSLTIPACSIDGLYTDTSALKIYLQFEDGEKTLIQDNSFFVENVGNYVLTYEYETPFNTYTTTCTIKALASENITFSQIFLPEYFIKNAKYTLDAVYAYEYTEKTPTQVESKMYMSEDGGEYVEVDHKSLEIKASSKVQFMFEHKGNTRYSNEIQVLDVGFGGELQLKDYFYDEAGVFTSSATAQSAQYITSAQTATLKYINVLSLSAFNLDITALSKVDQTEYKAPETITIELIDYYNRDRVVTLVFENNGETAKFYMDGVLKATPNVGKSGFIDSKFSISYKGGIVLDGKTYPLTEAFANDKFILHVTLGGIEQGATACLDVSALCGGKITKTTADKVKPTVATAELNTGYQSLNKVIKITQATANDIFSPYLESGLKLVVKRPDGSYATSVDGVKLDGTCPVDRDYELKLDTYGRYNVSYTYTDQGGYKGEVFYDALVEDETAPVLKVDGVSENQVFTAKLGATITVATYTATDDMTTSEALKAWVCVFYPTNIIREVANGGSFVASDKGKYTVLYSAYDEKGNYTTFGYVIIVS